MSVEVLTDTVSGKSALTCTTSGQAFGPVFAAGESAEDFLDWLAEKSGGHDGFSPVLKT